MENKNNNLDAIYAKKSANTHKKVDEAILELNKAGKAVNFNSVAKISGLSKTTLYNNQDIRERIASLAADKSSTMKSNNNLLNENNKDAIIESLKRKLKSLSEENKFLKEQLECAYSKYYNNL